MRIQMTDSKPGSINGREVNNYEKGKFYDLPDRLAGVFIDNGHAVAAPLSVRKAAPAAPDNKAVDGAPDDKKEEPKKPTVAKIKDAVKGKGK